jgi:hypothetical protein
MSPAGIGWEFIPGAAIKVTPGSMLAKTHKRCCVSPCFTNLNAPAARRNQAGIGTPLPPLFEMKCHASGGALVADGCRPLRMHRTRIVAALAADNNPINSAASAAS